MEEPQDPPLEVIAGRYRLLRLLGTGGMGDVYLAHDDSLDRDVAIKFIGRERIADADARGRLLREARAAAALDHPAICAVFETGETTAGRSFIVMQHVAGEPLTSVLARGPLPVRDALTLCTRIAEALDVAHSRGIVHRDLKPGNVMVSSNGQPKLVDFGIAKVLLCADDGATTLSATAPGIMVGTPAYMSPEQAQQRPVDGRSDLFSLGALLYECLTGRRAFEGATAVQTLGAVLHVHPPPPSTLRPELDDRHDELCRRLLAKEPDDRFQSAREVVGAVKVLLPDTTREPAPPLPRLLRRSRVLPFAIAAIVLATGAAAWFLRGGAPAAPPDAEFWYRGATDALHQGASYRAAKSLERAVTLFPQYTLAYARLAEAHAEMDDQRLAQDSLLRVGNVATLTNEERLRVTAVKALVMRDVDSAVEAYAELTRLRPDDAGAWVDLGRAQESAGLRAEARNSYLRAIETDQQYAPAYTRLGTFEALDSRRDEALEAFAKAERLYAAVADVEGQAEVLLRRGAMYDSFGELKAARADLERALSLATSANAVYQQVRARLSLSSVTASEGRLAEAERAAADATQEALTHGLETVAADGLLDLASILQTGHVVEAETTARRAVQLADSRGARRTSARGRVQLAGILQQQGRDQLALDTLSGVLPFLKENRYRRFELLGLSIAARAHVGLDQLEEAQRLSASVLHTAEALKDDGQTALAAGNLALVMTALGNYPEALRLRLRAEDIHKRQGDNGSLPYDLANRAELLIRLGRTDEANAVLLELESGIAAKVDTYMPVRRRAILLRTFAAATLLRCGEASVLAERLAADRPANDSAGIMGPALAAFCSKSLVTRPTAAAPEGITPPLDRERLYWLAAAALRHGDWQASYRDATSGLELLGAHPNDELRWRLSTVAAVAASQLDKTGIVSELSSAAHAALRRAEAQLKDDYVSYRRRPDLVDLVRRAEQSKVQVNGGR